MKLIVSPSVVSANVGREQVLLDARTGIYFGLNEVAARFWQQLMDGQSYDDAVATICREFDAPESQIALDVRALLGVLESHGLVTVGED